MGGGMFSGGGGGAAAGGGTPWGMIIGKIKDRVGSTVANFDSIAQGNAGASIAAGQSAAAGGGVNTPGVGIMKNLTAQDIGAQLKEKQAADSFRSANKNKKNKSSGKGDGGGAQGILKSILGMAGGGM